MRATTRLELSETQWLEFEWGCSQGERIYFRMRCHAILLKAGWHVRCESRQGGQQVDLHELIISMVARYKRIRKYSRGRTSPYFNISETLWRLLKGKWIRPQDYAFTDSLFYTTDRALASVGTSLFVNHSHYSA